MRFVGTRDRIRTAFAVLLIGCCGSHRSWAQVSTGAPSAPQPTERANTPDVPDWALPGSATHKQYPPPKDFHRPTKTFDGKIGTFDAQSDVGGPLVSGSASFDPKTGQYTVNSAGYNIWYTRDEFRYLWKRMSGDVSLAADVSFPVPENPPHDRKVVLVIRQDLEDDSKEIMAAEHGTGMVHLAQRPEKNELIKDMQYRVGGAMLTGVMPKRIGIEKRGDSVALFVSVTGEPMHQFGPPMDIHFDGPFYIGIGFCSHYPVTVDSGTFSNVVLKNASGKIR